MPRYGFNFQWMYAWKQGRKPEQADRRALDFLAELGFDSARIPVDYRFWTKGSDYRRIEDSIYEYFDSYVEACGERGIQACINLHRAPGYCINAPETEAHNLWLDEAAQDGFAFIWESFARHFAGMPSSLLCFDLLNEPPSEGERGMSREIHAAVIRRAAAAIRAADPGREIVIDGIGGGGVAVPELADLGAIHSGRGYAPMGLSHYKAGWWEGSAGLPEPDYPGLEWEGKRWDQETLREYYAPWRELESMGVKVLVGECGCYGRTPNEAAMRWYSDLFGLFKEYRWGFSLWNFEGPFGIVEHGRPGARFERYHGYKVDRALLDLLLECRA
jgi:endoglucanase